MSEKQNVIAFIFARCGSKGLPGKNIRLFNGMPLIAWSIQHAKLVEGIRRVIVSTDCMEIADVAIKYGAEVPFLRPSALATDDAPEWLAWRHAVEYICHQEGECPDAIVSVPVTAPLRWPDDIKKCLDCFFLGGSDIVVTMTDAHRNPYFNMLKQQQEGLVELVMPLETSFANRQDAPKIFDMTTVAYVANPEFVLTGKNIFSGKVKAVYVPPERAIDIDTLMDFEIAEFLIKRRAISQR